MQQRANAVVSLMSYAVVPDITASNLDIGSGTNDTSALTITQLGGGATLSEDVPLYLEGTLGYSRYDPQFVSPMQRDPHHSHQMEQPERHRRHRLDVGVHRDRLVAIWCCGPSPMSPWARWPATFASGPPCSSTGRQESGLPRRRHLNVYGLGGSLMLDYELFSAAQDIDAELRYSYQHLQSFTGTAESVSGQADAENLGLYLRRRAPLWHWTLLDRPLRYVLEGARTEYLGSNGPARFQQPQLPGSGHRTRQQQVRHLHHPHPAGGPLYVQQQYQRLLHRTGDEFLALSRHWPSLPVRHGGALWSQNCVMYRPVDKDCSSFLHTTHYSHALSPTQLHLAPVGPMFIASQQDWLVAPDMASTAERNEMDVTSLLHRC
nr:hypothetical protein [Aeromonas caviae]